MSPPEASTSRTAIGLLLAALVVGAILVLPRLFVAARVLAQGTTPPGLLVHREGRVVGFSDCYRPAAYDGQAAMQVSIDDAKGIEIVTIPCLDDRGVLATPPAHRLGVDVDPRPARAGRVYQVTLDGRTLLSVDAIADKRQREVTTPALVTVAATLAVFALACLVLGWLLLRTRMRRRAPRQAPE